MIFCIIKAYFTARDCSHAQLVINYALLATQKPCRKLNQVLARSQSERDPAAAATLV